MGRKKSRRRKRIDPSKEAKNFRNTPFADLDLPDLPEDDGRGARAGRSPSDSSPPSAEEGAEAAVDPELARAFGAEPRTGGGPRPVLRMRLEKKGRGGKSVTVISGFGDLDLEHSMQLVGGIKRDLGIGGRLVEDELELQGDQRSRAADWFEERGFRVKGKS